MGFLRRPCSGIAAVTDRASEGVRDIRTYRASELLKYVLRRGGRGTLAYLRTLGARGSLNRAAFFGRLLRVHAYNLLFDIRHSTQTRHNMSVQALEADDEARAFAAWYTPVPVQSLRYLLDWSGISYSRYVFVDYGAGMGRALLVAARFRFASLVGVEFAANLASLARSNLDSALGQPGASVNWEYQVSDARDYRPPAGPSWLFLYASFRGNVLASVLHNIQLCARLDGEERILCFVDDHIRGRWVPEVVAIVEQWPDWERLPVPPLPHDPGALYPLDVLLYRHRAKHAPRAYRSPRLSHLGAI